MTFSDADFLNSILEKLESLDHIKLEDIPSIDLYMDQVTTLIGEGLRSGSRNPDTDKILTKTMINNYAKNDLLPPPVKKKYSREHVLILIFIYYFKGVMSINDISAVLEPITKRYFHRQDGITLETIYKDAFEMEKEQIERMKKDVTDYYGIAQKAFEDCAEEDRNFLQTFYFICLLSFDVYVKRLLIEKLVDALP